MPCFSPLRACLMTCAGKRKILFQRDAVGTAVSLPCGRCIGCRLERARQWAVRLVHERKSHEFASFLTLTYSDEFLPKDGSLSVLDCQLFLKRLRSRLSPRRIRFFLCGEYGEETRRPHYHAILFGYDFPDKKLFSRGKGRSLFVSSELLDVWGKGHCSIGDVTFESACYVANYATKKITGEKAEAFYGGRKPEFVLMSRRPGIGRSWIEEFWSDVYPSDEVIVRGVEARPPRYYDNVIKEMGPALLDGVKVKREVAAGKLETVMLKGRRFRVRQDHPYRLDVKRRIAEAKFALKEERRVL